MQQRKAEDWGDSARRAAGCACHAISIIARSLLGAHPAT